MDDTANWEFAAVVAAVCIGLGGLLLFTLIGAIGAWRTHDSTGRAAEQAGRAAEQAGRAAEQAGFGAEQAARAADSMGELARAMITQAADRAPMMELAAQLEEVAALRRQAEDLLAQQTRLQDAVRHLVEAGVLRGEESGRQLREVEQAVRRMEEQFTRMTGGR